MDVVAAAFKVRLRYFGRRVKLNYLVNIKSGLCPEDCSYCSQRLGSSADVLKYTWLKPDEVLSSAEAGVQAGAKRVCLVASGRGPNNADITRVSTAIDAVQATSTPTSRCAPAWACSRTARPSGCTQAGTTAYNHNLNTAESNYRDICTTHDYADRADTVQKAKHAGLSPCSGLIAGMGETDEELVDVVFALRELDPDSVPVNFLIPFEGTPLGGEWNLTPQRCLRILAMVRFACPDAEVRLAGGREIHLRSLQPLALHIVNSIFLGDYLTSEGQAGARDLEMIADAGFTVEGAGRAHPARAPARSGAGAPPRSRHRAARECLTRSSRVEALERAAARHWQAPDTEPLGEWSLRAAAGFTGRANSALPLGDPGRPLPDAVTAVEEWYRRPGPAAHDRPAPGCGSRSSGRSFDRTRLASTPRPRLRHDRGHRRAAREPGGRRIRPRTGRRLPRPVPLPRPGPAADRAHAADVRAVAGVRHRAPVRPGRGGGTGFRGLATGAR